MSESPLTSSRSTYSPARRQEWSLLNQHKALEYQLMQQAERALLKSKKQHFKEQLEWQMQHRSDRNLIEKQQDVKYAQNIAAKNKELQEKQRKEKQRKVEMRRQAQEYNQRMLDKGRRGSYDARFSHGGSGYQLDIGLKSAEIRAREVQHNKRIMQDSLDQQIAEKQQSKRYEEQLQNETDKRNLQIQQLQYQNRNRFHKNFGQNPKVYQHYSQIQRDQQKKDQMLERVLVEQAARKKWQQDGRKMYQKQRQKSLQEKLLKEQLDRQVKIKNIIKQQTNRTNPQQVSYGVIANMFRPRQQPYNKQQYSRYLRQQAQQAQARRQQSRYMTSQEMKLNLNQLNKAVDGQYAHNAYIDRSIGALGDGKVNPKAIGGGYLEGQDVDVVRRRVDQIKRQTENRLKKSPIS